MGADGPPQRRPDRAPIRVGIVDTGVSDHQDLPQNIRGTNFVDAEDSASWRADHHRHGTLIAGIISACGSSPGYVPEAELAVYKAFPRMGSASTIDIARAITQAADDRIDVLCLAFCSETSNIGVVRAIEYAGTKGVFVCAAAGNKAGQVGWPAASGLPNVISTAAFGRTDVIRANTIFEQAISDYNNAGFFHAAFSSRGTQNGPPGIDVIAPGVACISTVFGGYAAAQGTSLAAAHVAGLVAFAMMRRPEIFDRVPRGSDRVELVREWLIRSCRPFGWGIEREGRGRPSVQRMLSLMEAHG
nr:S8 family serine peptidase [Bradyrhizobium sp. dw_411]